MNDGQTARYSREPLADDGIKIATVSRGPNRELRIRWREFQSHHFLDLRE